MYSTELKMFNHVLLSIFREHYKKIFNHFNMKNLLSLNNSEIYKYNIKL